MGCVRYLRAPPRFAGTWALRGACGERGWAATGRAAGRAGQGETKVLLLLLPRVGGVQGCVGRAVGGGGELRPGWLRGVQLSRVLRSVRTQPRFRAFEVSGRRVPQRPGRAARGTLSGALRLRGTRRQLRCVPRSDRGFLSCVRSVLQISRSEMSSTPSCR